MIAWDSTTQSTRLILFDIDGTLLLSGGAGKRALNRTFQELFDVPDGFDKIPVAGRTDRLIFEDALTRAGVVADRDEHDQFYDRYFDLLEEEILNPGPRKGVMPGVRILLSQLGELSNVTTALLTGNFSRAARIKLEYFDLWHHFVCGAFGDDALARDDLVPVAVDRARQRGVALPSADRVVVVGDTPLDIQCAKVAGARSVAVATGIFNEQLLQTQGADIVLKDLTDTEGFIDTLYQFDKVSS